MKRNRKRSFASFAAAALVFAAAIGCESKSNSSSDSSETSSKASQSEEAAEGSSKAEKNNEDSSKAKIEKLSSRSGEKILPEADEIFSDRDLEQEADTSDAKKITVADGKTIDISEAGVYMISGSAKNCTIRVEADKKDKVRLVLDGVNITNEDFPAIYVVNADKCFVTTAKGSENSLSVTGDFKADGDTNTDAVIFSKDDLVLSGLGSLEITSKAGNGVSSKDGLKITGGSYKLSTAKDAFEAKEYIAISDGSFDIETDKDGFHAEDKDDDSLGWIFVKDGEFNLSSKSDGVQATTCLRIDGGKFDITSSEGLEATSVQINGGDISISASDDGINASPKSSGCDVFIEVNGGELTIVMGKGDTDGLDANGSIYVNGGKIDVTAPMSSFDYDDKAEFNGGTIIINGEEVSEIPEDMMGGHGGGPGGGFGGQGGPGGFGGQGGQNGQGGFQPPEGFGEDFTLPEGFDFSDGDFDFPDDFDPFDGDFDFPDDFDPSNGGFPGGFGQFGGGFNPPDAESGATQKPGGDNSGGSNGSDKKKRGKRSENEEKATKASDDDII